MAYIKYDVEEMNNVKDIYEQSAKDMEDIQTKITTMESTLREAWKSDAGRAFFANLDDEWLTRFTLYKDTLDHMAELLKSAAESYQTITDKADSISF